MTRALWIIQGLLAASAPLSVRRRDKIGPPGRGDDETDADAVGLVLAIRRSM